jgi:Icc-related predicted phosphoesterase
MSQINTTMEDTVKEDAVMEDTVTSRFLIISDTHSVNFDDVKKCDGTFYPPFPKADVILHCGDLTGVGRLQELRQFVEMMREMDAELKLVIAGNHDMTLDSNYWKGHMANNFTEEEHKEAVEIMTGWRAKEAGITYLTEGLNTFTLKNGARFTIYTSPYTPEFCDWGFPYERYQDRFNTSYQVNENTTSIAVNPIPDHGSVDIVMTHGPPLHVLDECANGYVGCNSLLRAVSRCRPRLHCFGHIHEGHGAQIVTWKEDEAMLGKQPMERERRTLENKFPEAGPCHVEYGKETLMVNAAIMDVHYNPVNKPWLLDLELPRAN